MANGQTVSNATANVVVVAADADRLGQYEDALRKARVATRATLDADEAEGFVSGLSPDVLVLDRGLPRLILFRLYGLVREDPNEPPVQVVFVGQEGETGPGDHYLPGDPSPSNVAERVTELLASASTVPSTAPPNETAAPPVAPSAPEAARPSAQPSTAGVAAAGAAAGAAAAQAPESASAETAPAVPVAPVTNGVTGEAVATEAATPDEAPADVPTRSGRRLDVILIRVGLVLLILGALLILIQSDAFPPALTPPGSAPATPTRRPAASPKPGAFLDGSGLLVPTVLSQRQG